MSSLWCAGETGWINAAIEPVIAVVPSGRRSSRARTRRWPARRRRSRRATGWPRAGHWPGGRCGVDDVRAPGARCPR